METSYWYCTDCKARLEHTEKGALAAAEKKGKQDERLRASSPCSKLLEEMYRKKSMDVEELVKLTTEQAKRLAAEEERNNMLARINEEVNAEIEVVSANEDDLAVELVAAEANACHGEDHCEALHSLRDKYGDRLEAINETMFILGCHIGEGLVEGAKRVKKMAMLTVDVNVADLMAKSDHQAANIRTMQAKIEELEASLLAYEKDEAPVSRDFHTRCVAEIDRKRRDAMFENQTLRSRIARLMTWKENTEEVEKQWDVHAVAKALGVGHGPHVRPWILPGIESLQAVNRSQAKRIEELGRDRPDCPHVVSQMGGTEEHEAVKDERDRARADIKVANKMLEARGRRIDMLEERLKAQAGETVKCNQDIERLETEIATLKSTISRPNQAHREILDSTHRDVERIQHLIKRIDRRIARAEARGGE